MVGFEGLGKKVMGLVRLLSFEPNMGAGVGGGGVLEDDPASGYDWPSRHNHFDKPPYFGPGARNNSQRAGLGLN